MLRALSTSSASCRPGLHVQSRPCWQPTAHPASAPQRCHNRVNRLRSSVHSDTGGRVATPDGAPLGQAPAFSPAQQELWAELATKRAESRCNMMMGNVAASYSTDPWCQDLHGLFGLPKPQQEELAWHVLARLRHYLHDMDGPVSPGDFEGVIVYRAAVHGDYSPLVWALGLQQPVAPAISSPLPPPADPPLETIDLDFVLGQIVSAIKPENDVHGVVSYTSKLSIHGHLSAIQQVIAQLSEEQEALLEVPVALTEDLWALYRYAGSTEPFWRLVKGHPVLHPDVFWMVQDLPPAEVRPFAKGLLDNVPLAKCTEDDILWLVCRLDNAAGDRHMVLELLGTLALHAPQHPALFCVGDLLLKYVDNSTKPKAIHPAGKFAGPNLFWLKETAITGFDGKVGFVAQLTCQMSLEEMLELLTRLQLVLPPQEMCDLLRDMLEVWEDFKQGRKKSLLQLYDLLPQQLARPGWEPPLQQQQQQQQQHMYGPPTIIPRPTARCLLNALPDASKTRAAATKVLVVWRHMYGALDPAWCGGGLAVAAKAAGQAVKKGSKQQQQQPADSDCHLCPTAMYQYLDAESQGQVDTALQRLGLLAELRELHMSDEPAEDGDEGVLGFAGI